MKTGFSEGRFFGYAWCPRSAYKEPHVVRTKIHCGLDVDKTVPNHE